MKIKMKLLILLFIGAWTFSWILTASAQAPGLSLKDSLKTAEEALAKATPEDRLRTTCGIGFMFLTFEEMEFVQKAALAVTSRLERPAGTTDEQPMPVQMSDGRWAVPELEDDPNLVTQLTTEALVFNLASFLRTGGATTTAT